MEKNGTKKENLDFQYDSKDFYKSHDNFELRILNLLIFILIFLFTIFLLVDTDFICKQFRTIFFIISVAGIISIVVSSVGLFLKKNDAIRFAKLNELHNLRKIVLPSQEDIVSGNEETEEIKKIAVPPSGVNIGYVKKMESLNINHSVPYEEYKDKKNLKEEFLREYMNAIVEI